MSLRNPIAPLLCLLALTCLGPSHAAPAEPRTPAATSTDRSLSVQFIEESLALPQKALDALAETARELTENRRAKAVLVGFADEKSLSALTLAQINQRLDAVAKALSKLGVWPRQLRTQISYDTPPPSACRGAGCGAADRVEITVQTPGVSVN